MRCFPAFAQVTATLDLNHYAFSEMDPLERGVFVVEVARSLGAPEAHVRVTALDPTDPDPVEPAADDEGDQGSGLKTPQDASGPGDKAGNDTREKAAGDAGDKAVGGKAVGDAKSAGGAVDADADDMGAVKAKAKAEAEAKAKDKA